MNDFSIDGIILLIGFFLLCGVLMTKLTSRAGVPALVLFMILGMVLGSDISGLIYFSDANLAQTIGIVALIIILFEGGLQTEWKNVRPILGGASVLATVGVILTAAVLAIAAHYVLGLGWLESFLLGSIVGSTDAAAVFSVMSGQNIKPKMSSTLEMESGSNDPMAMFLTIAFIEWLTLPNFDIGNLIMNFFVQMGLGLILGLGFGYLSSVWMNKIKLDASGLYAVLSMGFAIAIYAVTSVVGGSGLLAVYVAGILIGTRELNHSHSIFRFHEGFAWLMQLVMFVILGLLVFPKELANWDLIWKGLVLSFILMFVARPVAVFLCTIFFDYSFKEKLFLSWAGLRGAVPIVLATFPLLAGVPNPYLYFNMIFFIVITSALLQGSTISNVARWLGLEAPPLPKRIHQLELISMDKANAEMLEVEISVNSPFLDQKVQTLGLPKETVISAIIRDGKLVMPTGRTKLQAKDVLYILTAKEQVPKVKLVLADENGFE
ncbi:potassium/proton antiporter [Sporosarcina oncorhynchi]|uniref:Potassium/proton antiporter n=1 Tax=Sporosarcina oncorhynchi TaxID=3056444 RepID=A0ABZ0L3E4_9BACL|nr:potassium/proton antiporter [Sporosarcina sp. T2O-4]WOV87130.1 potassium/proton antiporter [Sporosarcina sp. T2O-4]